MHKETFWMSLWSILSGNVQQWHIDTWLEEQACLQIFISICGNR